MAAKPKTTHPSQWEALRKDHPRQLWALERLPRASPLAQRVAEALLTGPCSSKDLDLLWELAHDLELYGRLDIQTEPPPTGSTVRETFTVVSKGPTCNVHGDPIYRVLLRHADGWWARLELRPDGQLSEDFQQDARSQVTLQGTVHGVSSGIAILGGLLRRIA